MRAQWFHAVPAGSGSPACLIKRSTKWTNSAPSAEGTEASGRTRPWPESLDGGAAASQLIQQVGEDVDPFRQSCVFVGGSSQKLGVNLLVGFKGCVVFDVIAGLKDKKQNRKQGEVT